MRSKHKHPIVLPTLIPVPYGCCTATIAAATEMLHLRTLQTGKRTATLPLIDDLAHRHMKTGTTQLLNGTLKTRQQRI